MVKNLKSKTCFTLRCLFFTFIWSNFINGQSDLKFSEVVRLNPVYLSNDKINDITAIKGLLREFCNTQGIDAIDSLEKLYNFELGDIQIEKLFPWLGTNDTLSIGRQGQKVEMPPFWATFSFNYNTDAQQMEFSKILKRCYPFVIYNHPFFEVDYQTNDPYFSEQLGLKNDNNSFADINIEEAWEIESGKSFIKVGVFDSGVDAHHEDINLLTGCHCYENTGIGSYNFGIDKLGHGTSVAGIIGANSNNSIGIAGIAGGGFHGGDGVSILDFKLTDSLGTFSRLGMGVGLIDATRRVGTYIDWSDVDPFGESGFANTMNVGYGINIANHSYNLKVYPYNRPLGGNGAVGDSVFIDDIDNPNASECYLCREAFLFSLKNGVINVVSRGNKSILNPSIIGPPKVPSIYDDSWIISVGSSDKNGGFIDSLEEAVNGYVSYIGRSVDLIAPGTKSTVYTTKTTHLNNNELYRTFNGSSAAAPHVTGVAALLLSKYNKPCYSNINLDPADVEFILQKSAFDVGDYQYDNYTGWGLLDAKKALDMIDFPKLQIIHPNSNPISFDIIEIDTIHFFLNAPIYMNQGGPIGQYFSPPLQKNYKVVRYNIELSYDFSNYMTPNTQLLDAWVRYSQTNSAILTKDTSYYQGILGNTGQLTNILDVDTFGVEPYAYIHTVDSTNYIITLRGFYYNFIKQMDEYFTNEDTTLNFWYPINPTTTLPKMTYSIYILDSTLDNRYDFPCDSLNILVDTALHINEYDGGFIKLFPNPSNDIFTLSGLDETSSGIVTILNLQGKIQYLAEVQYKSELKLYLPYITSDVYLIEYKTANFKTVKKWVKL